MADAVELSEREQEILRLVATGASNKEIALRLLISPNTVKVHLRNIFTKINVVSRTEATLYAIRHNLVPAPARSNSLTFNEAAPDLPAVTGIGSENVNDTDTRPLPQELLPSPSQPEETFQARIFTNRLVWIAGAAGIILLVTLFTILFIRTNRLVPTVSGTLQTSTQMAVQSTVTLRWQTRPSLLQPSQDMAATVYEQAVYIIGGENPSGVTNTVERYIANKSSWEQLTNKPTPVADIQGVLLGEKIYVPGGRLASGKPTAVLEVYDPRHDQWDAKASLPVAVSGYALAALDGRLYLFGGWDGSNYLAKVYTYDPVQDRWMACTAMPSARAYAAAVAADEKIYVIGGFDGQKALPTNDTYYPDRDGSKESPWSERAPLEQGRYAMGVTSLLDAIFVIGGQSDAPITHLSLQYNMQQDAWQSFENPPALTGDHLALVALQDQIFSIGGNSEGKITAQNQVYRAFYNVLLPGIQN